MRDEDLRNAGPPAMAPERHDALRARLLDEITAERSSVSRSAAVPRRARRHRRGVVAGAAFVVVAVSATAAAAMAGWLRPDPEEARQVLDRAESQVEWHNPGWRPELMSEQVQCSSTPEVAPEFNAFASDFPLTNAITAHDYLRACTAKAPTLGTAPESSSPALCARPGPEIPELVVTFDGGCAGRGLSNIDDTDLAALNAARRMEVSLLAFPEECPTRDEAANWVRRQIATDDMPLRLVDGPQGSTTTTVSGAADTRDLNCYRGWVTWPTASVYIDAYQLAN